MDTFGVPYDYDSIMHYNAYEFSKDDNKPTIIPKQPGVFIGQRIRLSTLDIKKIQILYGCIPRGSSCMCKTLLMLYACMAVTSIIEGNFLNPGPICRHSFIWGVSKVLELSLS